jgi:hypothetical protein
LISGHALQGLTYLISAVLDAHPPLSGHNLATAKALAVDIGDRRVFAGVHFPSDNLASWLVALKYSDEFWPGRGAVARSLVRDCVQNNSVVYKQLRAGHRFQLLLDEFDAG